MIKAIVTDIEGTTSSLSFVKDVLFPYARQRIGTFVRERAAQPEVAALLDDVRREAGTDLDLDGVVGQLEQWIDQDRKITPLKALQGLLWEAGYVNGDFTGHLYPDALQALRSWHAQGLSLYVYSSGSVYAQKLLFGYSDFGDLTPLFSGYFDTTIGAKVEAASYARIAAQLGLDAGQILFLSDIEAELNAARSAGMKTVWLVREGGLQAAAAHPQVRDFPAIALSAL